MSLTKNQERIIQGMEIIAWAILILYVIIAPTWAHRIVGGATILGAYKLKIEMMKIQFDGTYGKEGKNKNNVKVI